MEQADDVAAAFVVALGPLPSMKLQKLLYYAQVWSLAKAGHPLFADEVEAWAAGPVVDRIYRQHRGSRTVRSWPSGDPAKLGKQAREFVSFVVETYGYFSGDELSDLAHLELPWKLTRGSLKPQARSRRPIPIHLMAEYYRGQIQLPIRAVEHAFASAELEGQTLPIGLRGPLHSVATGQLRADDLVANLVATLRASG